MSTRCAGGALARRWPRSGSLGGRPQRDKRRLYPGAWADQRRHAASQASTLAEGQRSLGAASDVTISCYHDGMTKQTTVRLPEDLSTEAEAVARVRGTSVNALIVDALTAEIERVKHDKDFTDRARRLLARDRELLERLAK